MAEEKEEETIVTEYTDQDFNDLREIFSSNGWAITKSASNEVLKQVLDRSTYKVIIRDPDTKKIVGFARALGDDCWQAVIDLIIVHRDYQGQGIGKTMLEGLLESLEKTPFILAFSNVPETIEWLEQYGFERRGIGTSVELRKLVP